MFVPPDCKIVRNQHIGYEIGLQVRNRINMAVPLSLSFQIVLTDVPVSDNITNVPATVGCNYEMRSWWNRQTRYFEGVVSLARVRSSRIGLTILFFTGSWWNWQTRYLQAVVRQLVCVRVASTPPFRKQTGILWVPVFSHILPFPVDGNQCGDSALMP